MNPTPLLIDHEGNAVNFPLLQRLARVASLSKSGILSSLPEGMLAAGEDARILFTRGLYYHKEGLVEKIGDARSWQISLVAEPQNQYDPFAIAVIADDTKIGYVPRELAPDLHGIVATVQCRVAAQGDISQNGDSFFLPLLIAWSHCHDQPTSLR